MTETDNLLVRLRAYRARATRDSREDFITEIFGWLLDQSDDFSQLFLEKISQDENIFQIPSRLPQWQTQYHVGGERPDMVALTDSVTLIFEHKVGASLPRDQVERYRKAAAHEFGSLPVMIVGITGNMAEQPDVVDISLTWKDIHEWVGEFVKKEGIETGNERRFLEFQELLRYEGLGPTEPIDPEALRYYLVAAPLPGQLLTVFSSLRDEKWNIPPEYKVVFRDRIRHRMGLEFWRADTKCEWSPGVFLGCVLDGTDHMIAERLTEIRFQLILDFDQALDGHYQRMPAYHELLASLRDDLVGTEWTLYDHLQESNPNTWHPLYIERPLLDVLAGTRTAEEQKEAILKAGQSLLGLLEKGGLLREIMAGCDDYLKEREGK